MLQTFVVFLRAINVSGKNIVKMQELKATLLENECTNVRTYIQSGNLKFDAICSKESLIVRIDKILKEQFGIDTAIFVHTMSELTAIWNQLPFEEDLDGSKVFVYFMNAKPENEKIIPILQQTHELDRLHFQDDVLYAYLSLGMSNTKLTNAYLEKKLAIVATARNRNTIQKMLSL